MAQEQTYLDFDEYIRQGKPAQSKKARYWQTAIGLQAVDGLKTSNYLQDTARKHIEGEITIDEARAGEFRTRTSSEQVPEQVPELVRDLLHTNEEWTISQLMKLLGLKHRPNFLEYHLHPAIKEGYVRMLYPDSPRHPRQKYLLTVKGLALYHELMKKSV